MSGPFHRSRHAPGRLALSGIRTLALAAILALASLASLLAASGEAHARRDSTLTGDLLRAARMLNASRFDEAGQLITELERRAADLAEVRRHKRRPFF